MEGTYFTKNFMTKIDEIEWAIELAKQQKSKLSPEVLALEGMSSPKVRHLYNNLGALATTYFEVGSWKGASLISTSFGNNLNYFASDNFSEFNDDGLVQSQFERNCVQYLGKLSYASSDCWSIKEFEHTVNGARFVPDLYLFDGAHDFESHKKAVTHFFPMMADQFVFIVDDYSHPDFHAVKEGTLAGLEAVKDKYQVVKDWELWEEGEGSTKWWNGIACFLIERI